MAVLIDAKREARRSQSSGMEITHYSGGAALAVYRDEIPRVFIEMVSLFAPMVGFSRFIKYNKPYSGGSIEWVARTDFATGCDFYLSYTPPNLKPKPGGWDSSWGVQIIKHWKKPNGGGQEYERLIDLRGPSRDMLYESQWAIIDAWVNAWKVDFSDGSE